MILQIAAMMTKLTLLTVFGSCAWANFLNSTLTLNESNLIMKFVNPFTGYFICDYYLDIGGSEVSSFSDMSPPTAVKLGTPDDARKLKAGDSLYVQVNFLEFFVTNYLPLLNKPLFLFTGQWQLPYLPSLVTRKINAEQITSMILNSSVIIHWSMQNPHIINPKVSPMPYGILHENLATYARVLRNSGILKKKNSVSLVPYLNTHLSRGPLIAAANEANLSRLNPFDFYTRVAASQFILSPVGDRPDCYRHWEAIGLGAIPICNCPEAFRYLFRDNMFFVADRDLKLILGMSDTWAQSAYHVPDRRLIFVEHWRTHFDKLKMKLGFNKR
jgi:hypothetical protein